MGTNRFKNTFVSLLIAGVLVITSAQAASAQNTSQEYRDWQRAQQETEREHQDYLRTHSSRDYQQWQAAQQRERAASSAYQRASRYDNGRYTNTNSSRRYRVYRNGSTYWTDNRGAELLRQAVNSGYQQGYEQGQLDSRRSRRFNYNSNGVYRSGTFGYQSYVARNQYQYYFQQGFQRGYEDGYNSTSRYGSRTGATINILGNVLNTILNLTEQ